MIAPARAFHPRPVLLASASPRRRELLAALGIPLIVAAFEIDETRRPGEDVDGYLERIAGEKLATALSRAEAGAVGSIELGAVLAADTVVVLDGEALGKPRDDAEATRMLTALSGRAHQVKTRFAIGSLAAPPRARRAQTVTTEVSFRSLSPAQIARYVATGEGRDKAGAYAIQGIGGFAVRRIEGSYSNVVGLPVCEVVEALEAEGLLEGFPFAPSIGA